MLFLFLKGMAGALAPFSYLVLNNQIHFEVEKMGELYVFVSLCVMKASFSRFLEYCKRTLTRREEFKGLVATQMQIERVFADSVLV